MNNVEKRMVISKMDSVIDSEETLISLLEEMEFKMPEIDTAIRNSAKEAYYEELIKLIASDFDLNDEEVKRQIQHIIGEKWYASISNFTRKKTNEGIDELFTKAIKEELILTNVRENNFGFDFAIPLKNIERKYNEDNYDYTKVKWLMIHCAVARPHLKPIVDMKKYTFKVKEGSISGVFREAKIAQKHLYEYRTSEKWDKGHKWGKMCDSVTNDIENVFHANAAEIMRRLDDPKVKSVVMWENVLHSQLAYNDDTDY